MTESIAKLDMDLPGTWRKVELGEVATLRLGRTPSRSNPEYWRDGMFPWVSIADLNNGVVSETKERISDAAMRDLMRDRVAPAGTVLLSFKLTLGKVGLLAMPATHNEAIASVLVDEKVVDRDFMFFALQSLDYDKYKDAYVKGATLNKEKLLHLPLALPPIEDQRVIAKALQSVSRSRRATEQVVSALREMKWSAMRYLFSLGPIAMSESGSVPCRPTVGMPVRSDWPVVSLGEAAVWFSGGTPKTSNDAYWGGSIPWISAASLTSFRIKASPRRVTELGARNGTRVIAAGLTLAVVRGMSLLKEFKVGITEREVAFGQDCKALLPREDLDPTFFAYAVQAQTPTVLGMVDRSGHGTGRLATDQLRRVEIPIPPREAQETIASAMSVVDQRIAAEERRGEALRILYASLRLELMTGRRLLKSTPGIGSFKAV